MAGKPEIYDQAAIAINGSLASEATAIAVQYLDSDESIALLGLTINGAPRRGVIVAPGARMVQIDVSEFVPVAGTNLDILGLYLDSTEVELTVVMLGSGKSLITRGFIQKPNVTAAVGQNLVSKWTFIGYAAPFEAAG